jgi:formylglycine-generating enzyme required for sulfatase activity
MLLVRDDFWMAATRFMRALEIPLLESQNCAALDLFPIRHAEKILAAFGRAFGALPEAAAEVSPEQKQFLSQAVSGLAQDGKIICVRLALFAEMMKNKPWTPAALKEMGGAGGVGVTFLDETLSASTASPVHRYHQKAARRVLSALLPEASSDIKGQMKTSRELLEASGYAKRPADFKELLHVLDREIRLLTPTDPHGIDNESANQPKEGEKYYQLTHDYLVPALREWLTRKQKETRRGRAELLLADRAAVWNARLENRQLPSLVQWLQIKTLTHVKNWSEPQKKMMRKASRYHAMRALVLVALIALATVSGFALQDQFDEYQKRTEARSLVQRLLDADIAQVPGIIKEMEPLRDRTDPMLVEENRKAANDSDQKLRSSLALLPVDPEQKEYLYYRLLGARPQELALLRDALLPYRGELLGKLWAVAQTPSRGEEYQRLRAAAALATYDPENPNWDKVVPVALNELVHVDKVFVAQWSEAFRPAKNRFLPLLLARFRLQEDERAADQRRFAATMLADYEDRAQVLADLLSEADSIQFPPLFSKYKEQGERGTSILLSELAKDLPAPKTDWTVRFYKWKRTGERDAPADWDAVLQSPILDELRTSRLNLFCYGEPPNPPIPPTPKVPATYFAAVATTEVLLGEQDYVLAAAVDGGIRVWLDSELLIDKWKGNSPITETASIKRKAGKHLLNVEFFQVNIGYMLDIGLDVGNTAKDRLAKRQANAGIALLKMGQPDKFWPLLKHCPDPTVRSYLIERLAPLGVDAGTLVKRLEAEPDVTIRRALALSLGEYGDKEFPPANREALLPPLREIYRTDPDAGLHAAAEWLLRQWRQESWLKQASEVMAKDQKGREKKLANIQQKATNPGAASTKTERDAEWYVNGQGQTMVVFLGPVEFVMGSLPTEPGRLANESQHATRIGRSFAVAAKAVTVEEYMQFDKKYKVTYFPQTTGIPVQNVTWHEAATYCNWLSMVEGINANQWCYENVGREAKPKADYLSRTGYRLPTEAEMEFATRAGATTSRYFGDSDELLTKYAWYKKNAKMVIWPMGSLKPNDFGLFDALGNVWVWCQESYRNYRMTPGGVATIDREEELPVNQKSLDTMRGGAYWREEGGLRSALRYSKPSDNRWLPCGFRVARTFQMDQGSAATAVLANPEAIKKAWADALLDADPHWFHLVYPNFQKHVESGKPFLARELNKHLDPPTTNWTVRFYQWNGTSGKPPSDWKAILQSPAIDEIRMSRLLLYNPGDMPLPPTPKVPAEFFGVVATTEVTLGDGEYTIGTHFNDAGRVWLDDKVVVDSWGKSGSIGKSVTIGGTPGSHILKVEYYQVTQGYILDVDIAISELAKERLAARKANAAVGLLKMERPDSAWSLFKQSPDPRARTYLIHRLAPLGVDPRVFVKRLDIEHDVTIRRALLLALGNYDEKDFFPGDRQALVPKLLEMFQFDRDAGIHAAAEWLLRQWNQDARLKQVGDELAKDQDGREKKLAAVNHQIENIKGTANKSDHVPQ